MNNNIIEIHERVLQFLLDWKVNRDSNLLFILRRRPVERLQSGMWFLGNENYLATSFWTGTDWVNKTQSIYIEIDSMGYFRLRMSAKDDETKAEVFQSTASILGGFTKSGSKSYTGNVWTKQYEGTDYIKNLELFLTEDKGRIDNLLNIQRKAGYNQAFDKALNQLDERIFEQSLETIQKYRINLNTLINLTENPATNEVKNLRLKELKIVNIGQFSECAIQFGEKATCLIGENGGGKTTLIRAAALGLVGTGSPLIDIKNFELQNLLKIDSVSEDFSIKYAGEGSISVSYDYNGKLFKNGETNLVTLDLSTDKGSAEFQTRIVIDGFGLSFDEELGSDGDSELPILVIGYPQRYGSKSDGTNIKKRSPKPNAYDIIPLILNTEDNRIESLKQWISETWNQGDVHKRKVVDLFDIISKVLTNEGETPFIVQIKSAISLRKIVVTTPQNPEGLPFDLLSTGLSNLFGWIGHLISRMHEAYPYSENPTKESVVIFVDEVDNYLHPLVQARVIPILLDSFPNAQFVFTSHSPIILAALPNENVKAYRVEKGKALDIAHFYGRTIQDILLDEYGIKKRPAQKIQDDIDTMDKAIALNDKEEARKILDTLIPILGENDPAIVDAQYDLN